MNLNLITNRILHAAMFTPTPEGWWGLPIYIKGKPGVGKTHLVKALKRTGLPYIRLSPAERGEGQFGVVPVPFQNKDGAPRLAYPPADWVDIFANGGTIFLDEINTAPPALQAPLLGLTQLRVLGAHSFHSRVRVLAAANDTADAAGGWDVATSLSNRFGHFDYEGLSASEWAAASLTGFENLDGAEAVNAEEEEARVMKMWPEAIATARGVVASFISSKVDMLHRQPSRDSGESSRAWPSHRTVEYATYALASAQVHGLSESDTDAFMQGFVGLAWVREFATYRADLDLPNPADVLDGKVEFRHDPRRLDRTMAVFSSIAALVVPAAAERRDERADAAYKLMRPVVAEAADMIIPAVTAMQRATPILSGSKFKNWAPLASELFPLLREASVI